MDVEWLKARACSLHQSADVARGAGEQVKACAYDMDAKAMLLAIETLDNRKQQKRLERIVTELCVAAQVSAERFVCPPAFSRAVRLAMIYSREQWGRYSPPTLPKHEGCATWRMQMVGSMRYRGTAEANIWLVGKIKHAAFDMLEKIPGHVGVKVRLVMEMWDEGGLR